MNYCKMPAPPFGSVSDQKYWGNQIPHWKWSGYKKKSYQMIGFKKSSVGNMQMAGSAGIFMGKTAWKPGSGYWLKRD
jgi:hypothetical protein